MVLKALSKEPGARYISVQSFAQALALASRGPMREQPIDSQHSLSLHQHTHTTGQTTVIYPLHEQVMSLVSPAEEAVALGPEDVAATALHWQGQSLLPLQPTRSLDASRQ